MMGRKVSQLTVVPGPVAKISRFAGTGLKMPPEIHQRAVAMLGRPVQARGVQVREAGLGSRRGSWKHGGRDAA